MGSELVRKITIIILCTKCIFSLLSSSPYPSWHSQSKTRGPSCLWLRLPCSSTLLSPPYHPCFPAILSFLLGVSPSLPYHLYLKFSAQSFYPPQITVVVVLKWCYIPVEGYFWISGKTVKEICTVWKSFTGESDMHPWKRCAHLSSSWEFLHKSLFSSSFPTPKNFNSLIDV